MQEAFGKEAHSPGSDGAEDGKAASSAPPKSRTRSGHVIPGVLSA